MRTSIIGITLNEKLLNEYCTPRAELLNFVKLAHSSLCLTKYRQKNHGKRGLTEK